MSKSSSSDEYLGEQSSGDNEKLTPVKTRSKSQPQSKDDKISAQISEQIKLALLIDENGKVILQSIAGRPPSFVSTKRQGLHAIDESPLPSKMIIEVIYIEKFCNGL